jgi:C1A family cysteine protease
MGAYFLKIALTDSKKRIKFEMRRTPLLPYFFRRASMRYLIGFILIVTVFSTISLNGQEDRAAMKARIQYTQQLIDATNAGWTAGETSMSSLPLIEFQDRLGLILTEDREYASKIQNTPVDSTKETPKHVSWYAKGFITPIKDQAKCGSCYAFASCALLESYYLINFGETLDLSEQYFMMKTKVGDLLGGCKGNNLWVCAATCIAYGAPKESCCPYKAVDEACPTSCQETYTAPCLTTGEIKGFQQILAEHGPIVVGFMVYEDFRNYTGGVYKYVNGEFLGGHAVLIVGYNKEKRYWIVKNSWGTKWGETCEGKGSERGYFRIGFGECMIEMPYMGPFYAPKLAAK